jgi:RNA polymerase sigma-70 factor (ECF subfamily)
MANTLQRGLGLRSIRPDATDSDAAAVASAVADPSAFAPLYQSYVDLIYRYCVRRLGSQEDAEDATSLIFMKALTALPTYRSDGPSFRSWLFAIAHNTVTDERRRHRPTTAGADDVDPIDPAPSLEAMVIADEAGSDVRMLLARLPCDQADIVWLRLAGLSGPEIARVMERSPNTVKVSQYRAYTRLRALLGGKEVPNVTNR